VRFDFDRAVVARLDQVEQLVRGRSAAEARRRSLQDTAGDADARSPPRKKSPSRSAWFGGLTWTIREKPATLRFGPEYGILRPVYPT